MFRCYYCKFEANQFKLIINHLSSNHTKEELKYRLLKLCESSGKKQYLSKKFGITPDEIDKEGKHIHILEDDEKISISNSPQCECKNHYASEEQDDLPQSEEGREGVSELKFPKSQEEGESDQSVSELNLPQSQEKKESVSELNLPKSQEERESVSELNLPQSEVESVNELTSLIPAVLSTLKDIGRRDEWLSFHRLIAQNKFPTQNIAFQLFLDVAKWFSADTTTNMRYSKEVLTFWKTGYRLFHGRFIRFMSGQKNRGQHVLGNCDAGNYNPSDSQINFAVPSVSVLTNSKDTISSEIKPGVINEALDAISVHGAHTHSFKLCFDGKKIRSGLTANAGDIDLFGCEESPTLREKQNLLDSNLKQVKDLNDRLIRLGFDDNVSLTNIPNLHRGDICSRLNGLQLLLSNQLQKMKVSRQLALEKFKKLAGTNWRDSKYNFAISSIQTSMYEINGTCDTLLDVIDNLHMMQSELILSDKSFCQGSVIDMNSQENFHCLSEAVNTEETRYIKQRTDAWKNIRKRAKVTGSTAYDALGLRTLKKQIEHYNVFIRGQPMTEPSSDVLRRMNHGVQHEISAIGTLVAKILPVLYPNTVYFEEGCYQIEHNGDVFMVVSPDGSARDGSTHEPIAAIEVKCPEPGKTFSTDVHYSIPVYYVPQLLSEMKALDVMRLLYICYSEKSTTAFEVTFDHDLWDLIWNELTNTFSVNSVQPKRKSELLPTLQSKMKEFLSSNTQFIGEFKSVKATECSHDFDLTSAEAHHCDHKGVLHVDRRSSKLSDMFTKLQQAEKSIKDVYHLSRSRASEVLCFMISDLDRFYKVDRAHALPIAYGLKGYSLKVDTMRSMMEHVLEACDRKKLHVPVCCFDGQWSRIVVRGKDGRPLTCLQLLKDIYDECKNTKKAEIVKSISLRNVLSVMNWTGFCTEADISFDNCSITVHGMKGEAKPYAMTRDALKSLHEDTDKVSESFNSGNEDSTPKVQTQSLFELIPESMLDNLDDETTKTLQEIDQKLCEQITVKDSNAINISNDDVQGIDDSEDHGDTVALATENSNKIGESDMKELHEKFKIASSQKRSQKMQQMPTEDFVSIFDSTDKIEHFFTKKEMKIIVDFIGEKNANRVIPCCFSRPKHAISKSIFDLLNNKVLPTRGRVTKRNPKRLEDLCKRIVSKYKKKTLNIIMAHDIYPERYSHWESSMIVKNVQKVENSNQPLFWYSTPEMHPSGKYPMLCILDSHHMLTNLRTKVCTTGLKSCQINRSAWVRVAKENNTNGTGLNLSMVEDLIDKQNNAFALRTFSKEVEMEMIKNGDSIEANFCRLVREWYQAEDEPGLSAVERFEKRFQFRNWLLAGVNLNAFPPPTSHVKGIPIITYEGLLTSIERKTQLYLYAKAGSYNRRSVSTLDIENFFGLFQDIDARAGNVPTPQAIPRIIATAAELCVQQFNPERTFQMRTSNAPVYPAPLLEHASSGALDGKEVFEVSTDNKDISLRNHLFDEPARRRLKRKRKHGDVQRHGLPGRGVAPVRAHHKRDESKILPHVRLGIEIDME